MVNISLKTKVGICKVFQGSFSITFETNILITEFILVQFS